MNFLRKILKKKRKQDCYIVRGQKFLSEEEVVSLLAKAKTPHLRGYEESGLGRPLTADDSLENSWIRIYRVSNNESEALFYAKEQVRDGMDGSFATIEAFDFDGKVFYTVKKEDGEVRVFNHQQEETEKGKVLVGDVAHLKFFHSKMQVFHGMIRKEKDNNDKLIMSLTGDEDESKKEGD